MTLALAGCGRKGALDLPPNAMAAQPTSTATAPAVDPEADAAANRGTVFDPSFGTEKPPAATKGKKKSFVLDPILD